MVLHHEDPTSDQPYRWIVVRLNAQQLEDEAKWHELYVQHMGGHWCFHGDEFEHSPSLSVPGPETFFAHHRARPPLDLSRGVVLGLADEMPAR
ncbi:MAG TPA: hypothetical protein VM580_25455 [Labilithrix sp.]|nr:hypothetical protein [Labilithrix sp.]